MDSISVTILRYRASLIDLNILKAEQAVFQNTIQELTLTSQSLSTQLDNQKQITDNTVEILKSERKAHEAEVIFLKQKSKGRFKSYLIGFVAGAIVAVVAL